MTTNGAAIDVAGLSRSFGSIPVLAGADLSLPVGGVYGLLGPNGAGKTTTVRILTGVLRADGAQQLSVLGCRLPQDVAMLRPRIGVQTDTSLYDRLSATDNLAYFAKLYGMTSREAASAAGALLERFGLAGRAGDKVATFSKGMKQKALIARALIAAPELVFLDEPTAGLDPEAAHDLMAYIRAESQQRGTTFFITSHRLEEMESVCSRVGILAGGRIVSQGSPDEVARDVIGEVRVRVTPMADAQLDFALLAGIDGVCAVSAGHGGAELRLTSRAAVPSVIRAVAALPVDLAGVAEDPPTLQEAYLRLVRQSHDREAPAP